MISKHRDSVVDYDDYGSGLDFGDELDDNYYDLYGNQGSENMMKKITTTTTTTTTTTRRRGGRRIVREF